ncbi:TonB-dependent receptor [Gramella sp. GC03-9]|uniref:TonB-dependent receptor n=1 Tax=Christiangramia oceanisediminis TaxID=2920386 RepID=A0A9X2KXD2_9FLAO|nr:outer membrane beta-barrel protein [Gramella oceanisediminis]MCP9199261.1 TonB-dependent receptor [Gramella oceanisediminis]
MINTKFIPLILLLFPILSFSQSQLTGSVRDSNNEPVSYANIILFNAQDSTTVYRGTVTEEDGSFSFDSVENKAYVLKASFIGYAEKVLRIEVNGNTRLEPITLNASSDSLDEVTVNVRKPKVTRSVDRLVFDVENSVLSSGNTFDILKKTPGVIVSQGQLLVRNRAATVYINERKVYLSAQELQQLLEGFSAGNIKSVEVITNPPARYDAEGGAILNIVTSKNISIGYKGSFNASNTIARVPKYNLGTSQYYKNDWLNVFGSYNYNQRDALKKDESYTEFFEPGGGTDSEWLTDFRRDTESYSHSVSTILDFILSEKSTLNLSANLLFTPKTDSDISGLTEIYQPSGSLDSLFTTDSRLENETKNLLFSAAYSTSFGENTSFEAVANYIKYDDEQLQDLETEYFGPQGNLLNQNAFSTFAQQESDIFTAQFDISTMLGGSSFETGAKYSGLQTQTGQDFFGNNSGVQPFMGALSDELDYDENIYAAYASLSHDWDNISMKAGLRGEYTDVQGISNSFGLVNNQEYFQLFPTFYLMYTGSEKHAFGIDYSRRIQRPAFQNLNTYRYFLNENNFQDGNPNLMPAITNKINFNYTFDNKWSFDLYWDRADDYIQNLPFQDNQNRTLRTESLNLNYNQQFSLDISYFSYLKDWWYLSFYSSIFYMENEFPALESGGQLVQKDIFSTYVQAYNYLVLSEDGTFSAEVIGTFSPDWLAGSYEFDEMQYGIDIGLRKTFMDSRLVATIDAQDIFNSMNIPLKSQYLNQNNGYFARPESRMIRFGLIYKFGNFRLSDNNRAIDAEESERLKEKGPLD